MSPTNEIAATQFWHSTEIDKIAGALAKAQGVMENASKDSTNPHFKSKYADLAAVMEACRKPLSQQAVAIVQCPSADSHGLNLVTMLVHESGQFFASRLMVIPRDDSPQSAGSALTYARRYSLMAMAGIAPDDDDDGNAANARGNQNPNPYRRPEPPPPPAPRPAAVPPATPERHVPEDLAAAFATMADKTKVKEQMDLALEIAKDRMDAVGAPAIYKRLVAEYEGKAGKTVRDAKNLLLDLWEAHRNAVEALESDDPEINKHNDAYRK